VLFFGTGAAAAKFIVDYRKSGGGAMIIANSSTSPDVLVKLAGEEMARGVGLVQVVPSLSKMTIPVVREYVETLKKFGDPAWAPSAYGLEGFLAAKVLAEGLRRAGPKADRAALIKALGRLGTYDAGGLILEIRKRELPLRMARLALPTLPARVVVDGLGTAGRARHAVRPATGDHKVLTVFVSREKPNRFGQCARRVHAHRYGG
jgi:hypothetical protein